MRLALLFGFCLAFALVAQSFGEENDTRMRKVGFFLDRKKNSENVIWLWENKIM